MSEPSPARSFAAFSAAALMKASNHREFQALLQTE